MILKKNLVIKKYSVIELIAYSKFKEKYNRIDFDDILIDFVGFLNDDCSLQERQRFKTFISR